MKFERVDLEDVLRADADGMPVFRRCFEHEIMMSFFDDSGAEAFREWWSNWGDAHFGAFYAYWLIKHRNVAPENVESFLKRG